MAFTLLSSPFILFSVLPFLLIFTLVFAILQKTEILGKKKKQIDAIVALVVGLMFIAFGYATGLIVSLIPILGVTAVVILVFMLLYGMVFKQGDFKMATGLQTGIGVVVGLVVVISVLVLTPAWGYIVSLWGSSGSSLIIDIIVGLIIIGAIAAVIFGSGKDKDKDKD